MTDAKIRQEFKESNRVPIGQNLLGVSPPLGNITSYSARSDIKVVTKKEIDTKKYNFKRLSIERKNWIGEKVKRVKGCGCNPISAKTSTFIDAVEGEKGKIYFSKMQRCGSVWLCPNCMYKLMKARSEELYKQLKIYKDQDKVVLFVTFTIQHNIGDSLTDLHEKLLSAFNFANSHKSWINAKKMVPVEYLRTLEVLFGLCGWHPHLHSLFIGDQELLRIIKIFIDLYKRELARMNLFVNEHTVVIKKWNGMIDDMKEYLFKGMIEEELTGGNLKKSGQGKTFFELVDDGNDLRMDEYIKAMKGKRQYHHSKGFFKEVEVKTDEEILKDDTVKKVLFSIPRRVYFDIFKKGIALHLLNDYEYGGIDKAVKLLELYGCDTSFFYPVEMVSNSIDDDS